MSSTQTDGIGLDARSLYRKAVRWIAENDKTAVVPMPEDSDYRAMLRRFAHGVGQ